ncbi:MAG: helix-turn-helix domain-containing protein [Erysipelotrichaceae bacterium]|nr:helix-turn-helix domain-containing protein [Erysipelotrichaceae bacterium]
MKLLICEDDISTIDVLKKKINFKKLGIDVVLEAYNGAMSIDMIGKENPELILCDIGMPKVKGTEVLKFARKNNENTEFAFLTCYEDFKYAQMAIDYRATGYITKPFKLKQVEDLLNKMISNYNSHFENINEESQIKKDLLCSSVFKQISDGLFGTNAELIQNYLENNGMNFRADSKWKIVFTCLNTLEKINSEWSKDLLLYTSPRIHDEILNNYIGSAHTIVNFDDRFLWCITFVNDDVDDQQLEERCRTLNDFCKEHFEIEPVILISDKFVFYKASIILSDLYTTIRKIRFYGGKIFHQGDDISNLENETILNENQLLWYLKNRDESGYEEYINELLDNSEKANKSEQFKKEITLFYFTILKDNNISNSVISDNEKIKQYNDLQNNKKNLLAYSKELMNIYNNEIINKNDSDNIINRAKKFLDDNYHDNIDRGDVAEVAFVTPNYLSKLFRNNMGMNLREYINQLRIDESKRLLLSTNMSISEIASYVGYYNISYFSTVFRKLVGVSPAEWRMNGKNE